MPIATKSYLGDGVYIEQTDYDFILTAENGIAVTNKIFLEPALARTLMQYLKRKGIEI